MLNRSAYSCSTNQRTMRQSKLESISLQNASAVIFILYSKVHRITAVAEYLHIRLEKQNKNKNKNKQTKKKQQQQQQQQLSRIAQYNKKSCHTFLNFIVFPKVFRSHNWKHFTLFFLHFFFIFRDFFLTFLFSFFLITNQRNQIKTVHA